MSAAYYMGFDLGKEAAKKPCPAGSRRRDGRCRHGGGSIGRLGRDVQRDIAAEGGDGSATTGNGGNGGNGGGNGGSGGNGGGM